MEEITRCKYDTFEESKWYEKGHTATEVLRIREWETEENESEIGKWEVSSRYNNINKKNYGLIERVCVCSKKKGSLRQRISIERACHSFQSSQWLHLLLLIIAIQLSVIRLFFSTFLTSPLIFDGFISRLCLPLNSIEKIWTKPCK